MSEKSAAEGSIVTFYSYKGGTGRSMALANMAWVLASNGKKVLMVDWDLEAPGLHRYFHPFLPDRTLASSDGIIDFIIDYAAEAMTPAGEPDPDWYLAHANILRCAVSLNHLFPGGGTLDFVPAGRQDASYSVKVNAFNWQNFYDRLGGGAFLEAVKTRMRREYDYVLIDSRTGVSDTSGICTVQLPDLLVVCFTLNDQSIEGAAAVARAVTSQRNPATASPIKIFPVPTRVEKAEKNRLELARLVARERFDEVLEHLRPAARETYWGEVEIEHEAFYAFEEVLATIRDTPRLTNSMLASIERLTGYVTGGAITELVPLTEKVRLQLLADYARKPPSKKLSRKQNLLFYMSYSAHDKSEYLSQFLEDLKTEVSAQSGLQPEEIGFWEGSQVAEGTSWSADLRSALERTRFLVPLLSPAYFASEFCAKEFEAFRLRQEASGRSLILPLSWIPVPSYPAAVSALQWQSLDLPEGYRKEGLRFLLRLQGRRDEYVLVVSRFANLLVGHLHDEEPVATPLPSFEELRNPFAAVSDASARISPPRVHNLPLRSLGELFVGRERELGALEKDLALARTTVLLGLGGSGKTRLAVEYAWRFGSRYQSAFFVHAEAADLVHQVSAFEGGKLLARLRQQSGWLLILDGIDTEEGAIEVRRLLPQILGGSVLITSRLSDWPRRISQLPVGPLSISEAGKFLLLRTSARRERADDPASAARLAEALEGLPLTLELAVSAIVEQKWTLDRYLEAFKKAEQELPSRESFGVRSYPRGLEVTGLWGLEQLTPGAAALLRLLAYLAPEAVPGGILKAAGPFIDKAWESAAEVGQRRLPPSAVGNALAELVGYALAHRQDETVAVHSMVQDLVRRQIPKEGQHVWVELTLHLVAATLSSADSSASDRLRPHVAAVVEHAEAASIAEPTTRLMNWLAAQNPETAERILRRALELTTRAHGSLHPELATTLASLGQVVAGKGQLVEAESLFREALAIDGEVHEADAPEVARDLNNLVWILHSSGRQVEAEPLAARALEITERLAASHPRLRISSFRNMSQVYSALDRTFEAEKLLREAVALDSQVFGDSHPATAADLFALGQLLQVDGRPTEAEPLLRRALEIDIAAFGPDHLAVATDLHGLALLLLATQRLEEAKPLLRQALRIDESSLGPDHPRVARDLTSLAQILESQRRFEEAEPLYRRALAIFEQSLGSDHSATRSAQDHLRENAKRQLQTTD